MTDELDSKARECLSAMVDNEAFEFELFRTTKMLSEDDELRQHWHRYHLVSSVMRRETTVSGTDLSSEIASAIALETEQFLAPGENHDVAGRKAFRGDLFVEDTVDESQDRSGVGKAKGLTPLPKRGFQKFAVAASVAVAAVFGVQQLQLGPENTINLTANRTVNPTADNIAGSSLHNTLSNDASHAQKTAGAELGAKGLRNPDDIIRPHFQLPSGYTLPQVNVRTVSTTSSITSVHPQLTSNDRDSGVTAQNSRGAETDQQIQNYLNHMMLRYEK